MDSLALQIDALRELLRAAHAPMPRADDTPPPHY
jgi:hypothetical protein